MSTNLIKISQTDYDFVDFGVTKIQTIVENKQYFLDYLSEGRQAGMDYLSRNLDKRFDPSLLFEGACTVLCFLAPYGQGGGGVAGFAQGIDYHKVVKNRLFQIIEYLKTLVSDFVGRPFVDSAPVLERYWAAQAGLGFIGENNFLISPRFGLRTIIGEIICNIPAERFEAWTPKPVATVASCGSCGRCREACPTGALCAPFTLDASRCRSYQTIEAPCSAASEHSDSNWIFGCEECLKACPWNKDIPSLTELESNREYLASLNREAWQAMSQEEFDEHFSDSCLKRAGLEKMKENLKNYE